MGRRWEKKLEETFLRKDKNKKIAEWTLNYQKTRKVAVKTNAGQTWTSEKFNVCAKENKITW